MLIFIRIPVIFDFSISAGPSSHIILHVHLGTAELSAAGYLVSIYTAFKKYICSHTQKIFLPTITCAFFFLHTLSMKYFMQIYFYHGTFSGLPLSIYQYDELRVAPILLASSAPVVITCPSQTDHLTFCHCLSSIKITIFYESLLLMILGHRL